MPPRPGRELSLLAARGECARAQPVQWPRRLIPGAHGAQCARRGRVPAQRVRRSEARCGALTLSRKAPPQGSFPDCGKSSGAPGASGFLCPRRFFLPPLRLVPCTPPSPPRPWGRAAPIRISNPSQPRRYLHVDEDFYHTPPKPSSRRSFQREIRWLFFPVPGFDRKSQLLLLLLLSLLLLLKTKR